MSTGVPILPRDSIGYVYRDQYCSYRIARTITEFLAERYPQLRNELAADARNLNRLHFRRIIRQAVFDKGGLAAWNQIDRWHIENLPRPDRRRWQRILAEPPVKWNCSPP